MYDTYYEVGHTLGLLFGGHYIPSPQRVGVLAYVCCSNVPEFGPSMCCQRAEHIRGDCAFPEFTSNLIFISCRYHIVALP